MAVKLKRVNGMLKIEIEGQLFEPLSFKSFRPTKSNITEFAASGVRLFSILVSGLNCAYGIPYSLYGESWLGKRLYDLSVIDRQIEFFMENAPDGYFALMIHIDTRSWWLESHENYPNSYGWLSQMAADPEWREEAAHYLQTVISHVEEKYGSRMYGYFMLCGIGTEWLSDKDFQRSHPIKEAYYQRYTGCENAVIPSPEKLELSEDIAFYQDADCKLYHKAHAELISDTILYLAGKVQEIIKHEKLLGIYYGYLFELEGERLWNAGHQDYLKIFRSKDIDMISSPASYEFRAPDSTSAFMIAHKSLDCNDKLYYYEFDQRTYLSQTFLEGAVIPAAGYHCKDDLETLNLMRRDFMLCVTNGAALWWFDMWDGWYRAKAMQDAIANMMQVCEKITKLPSVSAAEIAVFVSGPVFYGVNKMSGINSKLLSFQRKGLAEMGAPYDVYSLEDIDRVDLAQYRLFVMLTAFELTQEQEKVLEQIRNSKDKTILWAYAPGYVNGGLSAVSHHVGMQITELPQAPVFFGTEGECMPAPYLAADDEKAEVLVRFEDGTAAVALKKVGECTSVYSALGNMSGELLRRIARIAGVHIYCENAPVYVNSSLLGIYNLEESVVHTRCDGVWEDIFSGEQYICTDGKMLIGKTPNTAKLLIWKEASDSVPNLGKQGDYRR